MRMWKKGLTAVLVLAACLVFAHGKVSAETTGVNDGLAYVVREDHVQITGYTGSDTELVIPDRIENLPVTAVSAFAVKNNTNIESLILGKYVVSVGDSAFAGCSRLKFVYLPATVETVDYAAFQNCGIIHVQFGGTEKEWETVGKKWGQSIYMNTALFTAPCDSNVAEPASYTAVEACTVTGYRCEACGYLYGVKNKSQKSHTYSQGICTACGVDQYYTYTIAGDGQVEITSYDGTGAAVVVPETIEGCRVTTIGESAFYRYTQLKTLTLPRTVKKIESGAFSGCTGLEQIHISGLEQWCAIEFDGASANPLSQAGQLYVDGQPLTRFVIPEGVTAVGAYAFYEYEPLTGVTMPEGLETVGEYAFYGCPMLQQVTFCGEIKSIGAYAFYNCTALGTLTMPERAGSFGKYVFGYCKALEEVTIPRGITAIPEYAFVNCKKLTKVTVSGGLFSIGQNAFYGCEMLHTVVFPDVVDTVGPYAFQKCSRLKNIDLRKVTVVEDCAFYGCAALSEVEIPGVSSIGEYAFYACTGLHRVATGQKLKTIGAYAFKDCTALSYLYLPATLTTVSPSAMEGCRELKHVFYGGSRSDWGNLSYVGSNSVLKNATVHFLATEAQVTLLERCTRFEYTCDLCETCWQLAKPAVSHSYSDGWCDRCSWPEGLQCSVSNSKVIVTRYTGTLTDITIPESLDGIPVKTVQSALFRSEGLKTVRIPAGVDAVYSGQISQCPDLTDIFYDGTLLQWMDAAQQDAAGGGVKKHCTDATFLYWGTCGDDAVWYLGPEGMLVISGTGPMHDYGNEAGVPWWEYALSVKKAVIGEGITKVGDYVFNGCKVMTEVTVPAGVTAVGSYAFRDCIALTAVELPDSVTAIDSYAFAGSYCLEEVRIPDGVTTIGLCAFASCNALRRAALPTSLVSLGARAFQGCAMDTVTVPAGVTEFGNNAFSESAVKKVIVSEGVAEIGWHAFSDCRELTTVVLPVSVKDIAPNAFDGCSGLTDVYYDSTPQMWEKVNVWRENEPLLAATFHFNIPGNVNDDNVLDTDDAVYLLLHVMFGPTDYPVPEISTDFNGDGKTDTDDAVYLLLHVMFGPGDYPLAG